MKDLTKEVTITDVALRLAREGYNPDMEYDIETDCDFPETMAIMVSNEMRKFLFKERNQWYWAVDSAYCTDVDIREEIENVMEPDTTPAGWWENYYKPMHIEKYGVEDYENLLDTFGAKVRER